MPFQRVDLSRILAYGRVCTRGMRGKAQSGPMVSGTALKGGISSLANLPVKGEACIEKNCRMRFKQLVNE